MSKTSKKEPRLSMFAGGGAHLARLAKAEPSRSATRARAPRAKKIARPERPTPLDERLDKVTRGRVLEELDGALKRKPLSEAKLAGVIRSLGGSSASLREELFRAAEVFVKRGTLGRDLWAASIRSLVESDHEGTSGLLARALLEDEGGGPATLSAAALSEAPELVAPLAKLASGGKPFVAFSAEIARVVRGDSPGAHLLHLAPIIKEAHRVALSTDVVVPLVRALSTGVHAGRDGHGARLGPGFEVLRSAERHLGRWLVFAESVVLGGEASPELEAREKARSGPDSSRAAWGLVAWALGCARARRDGLAVPAPPETRPTTELAARLSDRPSADKDLSFLFRLASEGVPSAKVMLEALAKNPLEDEATVRAVMHLARDYGRGELAAALVNCATSSKNEDLRGLALGAAWDAGAHEEAKGLADEVLATKHLGNVAWAARVRMAAQGTLVGRVVTEGHVRRLMWGSVE